MSQVNRELGELGSIRVSSRVKKNGQEVFTARSKGRRLDGKTISIEATGPSRRAAERNLRARWEQRKTERNGSTPPSKGEIIAVDTPSPAKLTATSTLADVTAAWFNAEELNMRRS